MAKEPKARTLSSLEKCMGHRFRNRELLEQAVTHTSHAHEAQARLGENGGAAARHNEQLEFLGDAVLGLITSEELFRRYPSFHEGQLSKLRAHLVSEKHLIEAAEEIKLGEYLRLGRGEEKSGGRRKPALLVDALEAVLGAMYVDAGFEAARAFVLSRIVEPELARLDESGGGVMPVTDYKSALQEMVHALGRPQPDYVLTKEEGPEHRKMFTVEARIHGAAGTRSKPEYASRGEGSTKKKAEQEAARLALAYLESLDPGLEGGDPEAKQPGANRSGRAGVRTGASQ
ncbi:MAG TPA: ribonuclease III [Terriglobales bacterium]|nr:ribonuclease III [Terriglobales bacterium]